MSIGREQALAAFHQRYPQRIIRWFEISEVLPAPANPIHCPGTDSWFDAG